MIEVFGKPNCPACVDLKRALDVNEIDYGYTDVTQDAEAFEEMLAQGFKSVPQVKRNGEWVVDYKELI